MTTINTIFEGIEENSLELMFVANDVDSDTVTITIAGQRAVMDLTSFMLAVEFMERAAKAVRRLR